MHYFNPQEKLMKQIHKTLILQIKKLRPVYKWQTDILKKHFQYKIQKKKTTTTKKMLYKVNFSEKINKSNFKSRIPKTQWTVNKARRHGNLST